VTLLDCGGESNNRPPIFIPSVERGLASANCGLHDRDGNVEFKTAPSDAHTVSANLIIRNFRHVYRQFRRLTLTHERGLLRVGLGADETAAILTKVNRLVTGLAT
jgi:hypothetical protein